MHMFTIAIKPIVQTYFAQQFDTTDWVWILIFILVLALVWWLLTRASNTSAEEAEGLTDQILEQQSEEAFDEQVEEEFEEEILDEGSAQEITEAVVEPFSEGVEAIAEKPSISQEPDDLTRVEGIGPKINQLLQSSGISTYSQLADADVERLNALLNEAGITIADPGTWPKQAKLADEGKWDELEQLQGDLKGGRER